MAVERLWVRNHRSLVGVQVALGPVTVVRGANGSGKTNLYLALLAFARGADGRFAQQLLADGGMPSIMWAGPRRSRRRPEPVRVTLGVLVDDIVYELAVGLPSVDAGTTVFARDGARPPPPHARTRRRRSDHRHRGSQRRGAVGSRPWRRRRTPPARSCPGRTSASPRATSPRPSSTTATSRT